jgi:DNA-binding MarR family transcriptional regulator
MAVSIEQVQETTRVPTADEAALVAEFRVALRRFGNEAERVARENGLTPRRYLLLLMIKGAPDLNERSTVTELAERLSLAQSSITELVARAETAGLVCREPSNDDARVVYLRLTAEGERRFASAFRSLEAERRALSEAIADLEV